MYSIKLEIINITILITKKNYFSFITSFFIQLLRFDKYIYIYTYIHIYTFFFTLLYFNNLLLVSFCFKKKKNYCILIKIMEINSNEANKIIPHKIKYNLNLKNQLYAEKSAEE